MTIATIQRHRLHFIFIAILGTMFWGVPAGAALPVERFHVNRGWYDNKFPIAVMHLEGSIEEMAEAHGLLLALHFKARPPEKKRQSPLMTLAHATENALDQISILKKHETLGRIVRAVFTWIYDLTARASLLDHLPERYEAAYKGFAQASGIDQSLIWDALATPDVTPRLKSWLYGGILTPPSSFGCTSVIWNSGPTSALHGRNLDYGDGVGVWDQDQVIIHAIPSEGLAHVAVAAMGIHALGVTAFNEAGLSLAVHQLTFDDARSDGTPMAVISAEVIRNARTIDDAIAIIRGFPRAGGWAYILSQGPDRAVVEASSTGLAIRRSSERFFYQTNHVLTPSLAAKQLFLSAGEWMDTFERYHRLSLLAQDEETRSWATPEKIARFLGDETRIAGGTIAKLDNVQSVIMDAEHRRLWIGKGNEGGAPNEGSYLEYRWADLRSAEPPEVTGAEITMLESEQQLFGGEGLAARSLLRRAMMPQNRDPEIRAALLREHVEKIKKLMDRGKRSSEGKNGGLWPGIYLHAFYSLQSGMDRSTQVLENLLKELDLALKDPDLHDASDDLLLKLAHHRLNLGHLYRGRILDLLKRREEALQEYRLVQDNAFFEKLKKAAQKGLDRPFSWEQGQGSSIDWANIDLYSY